MSTRPSSRNDGYDFLLGGVLAWLLALAAWKGFGSDQMGCLLGGVLFLVGAVLVLIGSVAVGVRVGLRGLREAERSAAGDIDHD